jgi:hypothetical protein
MNRCLPYLPDLTGGTERKDKVSMTRPLKKTREIQADISSRSRREEVREED